MKNINLLNIVDIYKLVLSGELKRFPNYTWCEADAYDNAVACTRYMLEELLNWSKDDIKEKIEVKVFIKYKLSGMLGIIFNNSPFAAISLAYPDVYYPWELQMAPLRIWNKENAILAFKWLIENKLKWKEADIVKHLSLETFNNNGLGGMIQVVYSGSIRNLLKDTYPKIENIDYFRFYDNVTNEDARKILRKEIENKVGKTKEDIINNINHNFFRINGLENILQKYYNHSVYCALEDLYPGEFEPWELKVIPRGLSDFKTALLSIKWLIEDKMSWNDEDVIKNLSYDVFKDNGLLGVIGKHFNYSPQEAYFTAYPNSKIKPWEFKSVGQNYWNDETIKEAIIWLVEDKLKINPKDAMLTITDKILQENMLSGLLKHISNGEALKIAYPHIKCYSTVEVYEMVLDGRLKSYPDSFWEKDGREKVERLFSYFVDNKLSCNESNIIDIYDSKLLSKYRLLHPMRLTGVTMYELLEYKFPGKYRPWDMKNTPVGYWNKDSVVEAVVWTLAIKIKIPKELWNTSISYKWIKENKLEGILKVIKIPELKKEVQLKASKR